ncbi:hypothetical protein GCM10025886_05540 [Tetragenococcus halophilus subsp. flandriensis]|uniref:hypothetical protein n=1 Tax=Tetragenococcus halophilus TaxID=51669 RepID=UPI0023E90D27|nr:hypothetical protein [Tetragenococcus halophilus]GMA07403.1 hypothetical protein GCM10025886_05540 [Tetragenococcus halophilus subsp. flandriensis]
MDWADIIEWRTIVVPEMESYISDESIEKYESLGYENFLTDNNHIMGFNAFQLSDGLAF